MLKTRLVASGSRIAAVAAFAVCALAGCAETVRTQAFPGLAEVSEPIRSLAVVPLRPTGSLASQRDPRVGPEPTEASALLAHHLAEALGARGVTVVPAPDSARALGLERLAPEALSPRVVARDLNAEFGVDAILMGEVWRFVERSGEAAGTRRPASVGFGLTLYQAPGGKRLWSGVFDETQQGLFENVLTGGRYPGGGTRWITVEEMARWGAREMAGAVPLATGP